MILDINSVLVPQWDLVIRVDGEDYAVRPLTIAEVMSGQEAGLSDDVAMLKSMFVGDVPPVETWSPDLRSQIGVAIGAYLHRYIEKKRQAVIDQVRQLADATSPTSTRGR